MTIPCDKPCVTCAPGPGGGVGPVDPDNPFANLSSEEADTDPYVGRYYTKEPPPLGQNWIAVGCIGWCLSTVSQEDANICALVQNALCTSVLFPEDDPNSDDPNDTQDSTVYYSTAQHCDYTCPNGYVYRFTVPAGTFASLGNQATADGMANSYACNKAIQNRLCLGALTPAATCSGSLYSGSITGLSSNLPLDWVLNGTLPDGLFSASTPTSVLISGVPTTPGVYPLNFTVTDSKGNSSQGSYSLNIFGITTNSPLPNAQVGVAYSTILEYGGAITSPVVWAITVGVIPDGMSLNATTGEFSGTPTAPGLYLLTVSITSGEMVCSKNLAITVDEAPGDCPFNDIVWNPPSFNWQLASGTAVLGLVSCSATAPAGAPFEENIQFSGAIFYTGPAFSRVCKIDLSSLGGDNALVEVSITSDIDGILFTHSLTEADGPGIYDFVFTVPASAGALITVVTNFRAGFIDYGPGTGSAIGSIDICQDPVCPDWPALTWKVPTTFNGSFAPNSVASDTFNGSTGGGIGQFYNEADFVYAGAGCSCKCDISVSGDNLPNDTGCKFIVYGVAPYTPLVCFAAFGSAQGSFVAAFTLPDTGGVPTTFRVAVALTTQLGSAPTTMSGVLSNV